MKRPDIEHEGIITGISNRIYSCASYNTRLAQVVMRLHCARQPTKKKKSSRLKNAIFPYR